jgi:hypothetical protein
MTTAEIEKLREKFRANSDKEQASGNLVAALVWSLAATELNEARCASIVASFDRSAKRRARELALTR